jgi:hypothetical protein
MVRTFRGWNRPLCETVSAYLLDQAGPTLLNGCMTKLSEG